LGFSAVASGSEAQWCNDNRGKAAVCRYAMLQESIDFLDDVTPIGQAVPPELVQTAMRRAPLGDKVRYRLLDYLFVLFAAPAVLPALALIACWVKFDDPKSPVFYRQTRYGKGGKPFQILKVRTMVPDADKIKPTLVPQSEDQGPGFKLDDDPRITRPGKHLRKLYLDELAQVWNVLLGDMSVVGPRANSADPRTLQPWQRLRLQVRPGVTGSWQIMRNKPRDFNERCRIDLDYIARKSIAYDVSILLRTSMIIFVRPTGC
jgi:lipopolysaccharide/colanic/teichoic acid biosynthesis glycosyltransferase